jgi:hypothetical protein
MTRTAFLAAAAVGLAAAAFTDLLLAAAGLAAIDGLQLGVAAAPLLLLAARHEIRAGLGAQSATALVVAGAAWTLAPLVDQHLTRAVVVDGALPDALHHLAGWPALLAGAARTRRLVEAR